MLISVLTDKGYVPGGSIVETGRLRHWESVSWNSTHGRSPGAETMVPPLIPHCFDHVWNLKRLSIITLPSRKRREKEREKSEQPLFISVRPCNNWMDRETPAREIDTAMSVENHATTSLTSDVRSPRTLAFMWRGALIWSRERSTLARSSYARV